MQQVLAIKCCNTYLQTSASCTTVEKIEEKKEQRGKRVKGIDDKGEGDMVEEKDEEEDEEEEEDED